MAEKRREPLFSNGQVVALTDHKGKRPQRYVRVFGPVEFRPVLGWRYEIEGDNKYLHAESRFRDLTVPEIGDRAWKLIRDGVAARTAR